MNTITLLLGACALAALSAGTAGAGPCTAEIDNVTKLLASKDAGAGPTAGGAIVVDAAHPDGYRLGQEIGADSGGATRHRSFFILDRTRAVGYEPGKRHNTDKAVLLRRYIE